MSNASSTTDAGLIGKEKARGGAARCVVFCIKDCVLVLCKQLACVLALTLSHLIKSDQGSVACDGNYNIVAKLLLVRFKC